MILTFIAFAVIAAGLYMGIKGGKTNDYDLQECGFVIAVIGILVSFIMVIIIILAHVGVDVSIEKNRMKYESLCERYELITSEYEDISKSDVINDITEWNQDVYSEKYWANNPWTNWFYSKRVVDSMEMIEMK